jgi:cell division protein FtsQ
MDVMGGDIGRNIFFVPLTERQEQLERIPWVESASVMRFVPNRLRIEIHERTPVAFARIASHISLIDAGGTPMELAPGAKHKYSFPVITGMNAGEPLSTRAARMKIYNDLARSLDSSGAHYSQELSEVDLSDPEDVKILASDASGEVLVHLGSGNYLQRYKTYVTHVLQWRQQFDKLESVDLRYDGQIIVNPDLAGMARLPALTPAAAKAAMAAGVKSAAIVNYEKYVAPVGQKPPPAMMMAKKDAKLRAAKPPAAIHATAVRAASIHHAVVKRAPAKQASGKPAPGKPAPATQASLKTKLAAVPGTEPAHDTVAHPVATPPASRLKKPSAIIHKETPQN